MFFFYKGIHLWSNNVRVIDNTANFMARGKNPQKFNFNLASPLTADDRLRIEFYITNVKKKKKKIFATFELILESLLEKKFIELAEENLSGIKNELLESTVQLKLYYTPPGIDEELAALGLDGKDAVVDWKSVFDEEGRHGGHRYRYVHSKHDSRL